MTRKIIETNKAPQAIGVYSQGIQANNLIFTSGQIPLDAKGKLVEGDFTGECRQVIKNIESILQASGSQLSNIVKLTVFLTDLSLFPELNDKINCNALNVPVQKGSMLDLSIAFENDKVDIKDVNSAITAASELYPDIIGITNDPIVSSDIIGDPRSLVFDINATMKAGNSFIKILAWYDNGHCHAMRILDVIKAYSKLEGFNQ